jgi:ubiquinone/menaquinone biosynthesis C-methylase UbiE
MNDRVYNNGVDRLRSPERVERLEVDRVVDLCLENNQIKSVLDVGTGSGLFAEAFANRNMKIAGADLNPDMLEAAKKHLPDTEFKVAVAEDLPFEDNSFDLVFMGVLLHEVNDFTKALQEAKRVTVKQVSVLEWKYAVEDFGPPLEHRLKEEFLSQLSDKVGFSKFEVVPLKNLVLYHFVK